MNWPAAVSCVALANAAVAQLRSSSLETGLEYNTPRPARRLSAEEANHWANKVPDMIMQSALVPRKAPVADLIAVATSTEVDLSKMILSENQVRTRLAMSEAALRHAKSTLPTLKTLAQRGNGTAYGTYLKITPASKSRFSEAIFGAAPSPSLSKDFAAMDLLRAGKTKAIPYVRSAWKLTPPHLGQVWGDGRARPEPELTFLLVKYSKQVHQDFMDAHVLFRRYLPALARLQRADIDREILALAHHKNHAYRKWAAVAAAERKSDPQFAQVLRILAEDPVPDVSLTADWALGRGPRPRNLR